MIGKTNATNSGGTQYANLQDYWVACWEIVPNSTRYTQNAVTLYTPNSSHKIYCIRQRADNGKFSICWFKRNPSLNNNKGCGLFTSSADGIGARSIDLTQQNLNITDLSSLNIYAGDTLYYSGTYDTLAEAIAAIQDPTTTYSISPSFGVNHNISVLPYSNADFVDLRYPSIISSYLLSLTNLTPNSIYFLEPNRISDNETIEVIS